MSDKTDDPKKKKRTALSAMTISIILVFVLRITNILNFDAGDPSLNAAILFGVAAILGSTIYLLAI